MDGATRSVPIAPRPSTLASAGVVLGVFTATLFLSALLLFSVQPMFAKMVLPKLGGSPSVWAVSMCFFQAVLLAGYCYAHLLNRLLQPRLVPLVHLMVLACALLAMPIGLPAGRGEPPAGDAYGWLIVTLGMGVGLPFFAVAANAPMLQAWFARSGHPHAADPYFLYGASNLGSLIALLAYPIAIEPFAGLALQAALWEAGFIALGAMIALCGVAVLAHRVDAAPGSQMPLAATPCTHTPVTWRQRASWVGLALVPSGLLVAFTSYVTTDIASAPFLWVLPLAAFLATFILVFREHPLVPHRWMLALQPIATAAVLFGVSTTGSRGWMIGTVAGTLAFAVVTLVCHKELYDRRPDSRHLTEFYLWMSLGGVLGGVFAAIVAPQVFNAIWEFPVLLVAGMACRPGALGRLKDARALQLALLAGACAIVLLGIMTAHGLVTAPAAGFARALAIVGLGLLAALAAADAGRQLGLLALAALAVAALPSAMNRGDSVRSFFGTHRIALSSDGRVRLLMHGTTIHGAQRLVDKSGQPVPRPVPATYYHPLSPMARGVEAARLVAHKTGGGLAVGIVGLGAGSMACHARADEHWRFFEIDPAVARIARDPARFTFLSTCRPDADIVLGDARLTLAHEPSGRLDYLVVDAFSSDSVPVHMMTTEAMRLFLDKLAPHGLLALHVSNRHMDIASVASAVAVSIPGTHVALVHDVEKGHGVDAATSMVVMVAKSADALKPVLAWPDAREVTAAPVTPWTDDYSDVLSAIWRSLRD